MKKILIALAASLGLVSAAYAGDFNNTQFVTTVTSGALQFSVENTSKDGLESFNVGAFVHTYEMGNAVVDLYAELGYNRMDDTMNLRGEYRVGLPVGEVTGLYGALAIDYIASTGSLGDGDFYFDPYVGASYTFGENLVAFGEVGYNWNVSNSWSKNGGYAEIGIDYYLNDRVIFTPSVVRTFDTGNNSTQAKLGVTFSF